MSDQIHFENIEKVYGDRVLLSVDAFTMSAGKCALITGDNGAGKTTLLKIVSGLLKPEKAMVCVDRQQISWSNARSALQSQVVYLHQSPYMFDTTVYENVAYGLRQLVTSKLHKASLFLFHLCFQVFLCFDFQTFEFAIQ